MRKTIQLLLLCSCQLLNAQELLPGFDGKEYREMLGIFSRQADSFSAAIQIPVPAAYHRIYRSPELGLKNRWDLWYRNDNKVGVISLRGTVADGRSWLENFYAAMVPATGKLQLNDSVVFSYRLASDASGMVHAGWLLGLASLSGDIISQLKNSYAKGIKEYIIFGHSQGAALAFLLRSHLYYLQLSKELPADMVFKTYCSAAPKPGNLIYAYDFDFITRNGWAFTIVNTSDWVPQTPFSVQTLNDFPPVNPFNNVDGVLKRQPIFVRLYLKGKFKNLTKSTEKAQQRFEKYLGKLASKQVKKALPQFVPPEYSSGNNYQRAGFPIVLQPDEIYRRRFPDDPKKVFVHHMLEPYYYLSSLYYPGK
ncbi:MAG TPA: hypothetical protein VNR87_02815 [Flavisolibacter sp.]|nr:hypothetical protein [Flavisolibacter sp.]